MPSMFVSTSRRLWAGLALASAIGLAGCSNEKWGFPYRHSVQQGNWITQEQVATLQVGMTREQVRFVLGSPTLTSVLHADRWDYPYYYQPGTGKPQERRFTVWFENESLARWSGDEQPEVQPFQQAATPKEVLEEVSETPAPASPDASPAAGDTGRRIEIHPIDAGAASQPADAPAPLR